MQAPIILIHKEFLEIDQEKKKKDHSRRIGNEYRQYTKNEIRKALKHINSCFKLTLYKRNKDNTTLK